MVKTQKKPAVSKEVKKKTKGTEPAKAGTKKEEKRPEVRPADVEENDPSIIEAAFEPEDAKDLIPGEFDEVEEYSDDMDEENDWE